MHYTVSTVGYFSRSTVELLECTVFVELQLVIITISVKYIVNRFIYLNVLLVK